MPPEQYELLSKFLKPLEKCNEKMKFLHGKPVNTIIIKTNHICNLFRSFDGCRRTVLLKVDREAYCNPRTDWQKLYTLSILKSDAWLMLLWPLTVTFSATVNSYPLHPS